MKFTIAATITAFASAVYAQVAVVANAGIAVNHPQLGEVATAGTTFPIVWSPIPNYVGPSANIVKIALMKGSSTALDTAIENILTAPIPVSPATFNWNVPATQETLSSYVLGLTGDNGAVTYSNYFTIMAATAGTPTNYTAPAQPAAVSGTASPSGSPASGNATTSGTSSAPKTSETSAATSLKAGIVGAAGLVSAIALLI